VKYSPVGHLWWYWLLIPAFTFLGRGISDIIRARQVKATPTAGQPQMTAGPPRESFPARRTGELMPPVPSVTEGTTRHLSAEAPTKVFESLDSQKPS
ncbi:MAG TPA: hypothetical protein VHD88_07800, partial [Pyrinomonadaceae bacterium]|nr:hypothetical protein [Pyrinomonadaceae bacterium]